MMFPTFHLHVQLISNSFIFDLSMFYWYPLKWRTYTNEHQYHTIIRAAFVCLFVCVCMCLCVPYLLWGPLMDLRQTWWVYVGGPPICPWGVLFQKGQRLDGSTGHFHLPLYYICASLMPHSCKGAFCLLAQLQSLIRRLLLLHLNGICRWTSQLLLRGSFSKRSTGRRVNGSTGQTG